jgi:ABC-type glycerol-3-phosphate transport system substrate-binding protein
MVMYWNRDIFTNKNITLPPVYWDEFLTLAPVLTEKDEANEILKSAISFGEFENVDNAKDILATLILQTGNSLIKRDTSKNSFGPSFLGVRGTDIPSSSEVLRFYTDFVDPVKKIYSWNRSLPPSKQAFLAGNLAVYFGHASELSDIRTKNPNLNFDVALIPQIRNLPRKTTFGDIKGLAIMNISKQKAAAYFAARMMTTPENTEKIAGIFNVESPARLILSKSPANPDAKVFYQSAIISRSWLDPNPNKSSEIFRMSISSINSGQDTSANIAGTMQERFTLLLQKN